MTIDERWEAGAPDAIDPPQPVPDDVDDDEDEDDSDDDEDEDDEDPEDETPTPAPPTVPATPAIHLHVDGAGRRGKKGKKGKKDEAEDPVQQDKVRAFIGVFRRGNRPHAGIELRVHRMSPESFDFGDGRGMRLCKGYQGTIFDPEEASEQYVKDHWGGRKFMLQLVGPDPKTGKGQHILETSYVDIDADPKPGDGTLTAPLAPSIPASSAVRIAPEESRLLGTAMAGTTAAAERANADRLAAEERAHAALREASDAKAAAAKAEAEAEHLRRERESIQARIDDLQKQLVAGGGGSKEMMSLMIEMRREDNARAIEEARRREKQEEERAKIAMSPLMDFIKQQEVAHERERKAEAERERSYRDAEARRAEESAKRDRDFFAMQLKFAEEQRMRLADEMKELRAEKRKEPDLIKQVETLASLRDSLDVLGGDSGSGTTLETVLKAVEGIGGRLPAIAVGLRHMITGAPLPGALPPAQDSAPPPGAVGGPPPNTEDPNAAEQRALLERLVSLLESTMANGLAPENVAETIKRTFPGDLVTAVVGVEPDTLLAELKKFIPAGSPLTTFAGAQHLRAVHAALAA